MRPFYIKKQRHCCRCCKLCSALGVYDVAPVKVAALQTVDQYLGGGNVGGNGDLMYIANPSFVEDLRIIFATVKILFVPESTDGIAEGQTTAMAGSEAPEKSREEELQNV